MGLSLHLLFKILSYIFLEDPGSLFKWEAWCCPLLIYIFWKKLDLGIEEGEQKIRA